MAVTWLSVTIIAVTVSSISSLDFIYRDHEALTEYLHYIHEEFPNITHLYSVGKSVEDRDLWVLAMGADPREHKLLQPELKYVGNIHGNEVVGRHILTHLIDKFARQYGVDEEITDLLNRSRVHIMVSMNPDGFEKAYKNRTKGGDCNSVFGRYNANDFDLNRNFPDYFEKNPAPIQPETRAIMDWLKQYQFAMSGNFHGGAVVANYPYDNYFTPDCYGLFCYAGDLDPNGCTCQCPDWSTASDCDMYYSKSWRKSLPAPTPDSDVFEHLAKVYSYSHRNMSTIVCVKSNTTTLAFPPDGITNGAAWYTLTGGMQDYNYIRGGCPEVTFEISCCKFPLEEELEDFWHQNRVALMKYLQQGLRGLKGLVKDADNNPVKGATVEVVGRPHPTQTTELGEYWRLLLPGRYKMKVYKAGYKTHTTVVRFDTDSYIHSDIVLYPSGPETSSANQAVPGLLIAATMGLLLNRF